MSKKYSEKLEERLWRGIFSSESLHTTAYLKGNPTKVLYQRFGKGFVCSIKRQKGAQGDNEGKLAFQTIAIELSKQPKKKNT